MTGSAAALPVWIDVMKVALARHEPESFDVPAGVAWREVCSDSGMKAVKECPNPYREIFVDGQSPTEPCPIQSQERALDARQDEQLFESLDREQRERAGGR
jgi:membrane carboxypeptidase/penicillin-binding protein